MKKLLLILLLLPLAACQQRTVKIKLIDLPYALSEPDDN